MLERKAWNRKNSWAGRGSTPGIGLLLAALFITGCAELFQSQPIPDRGATSALAPPPPTPAFQQKRIPPPTGQFWEKGFKAYVNHNYQEAMGYFEKSDEVLAKYYLAKLYFGDVDIDNFERKPSPIIHRPRAIEVLGYYPEYEEIKNLRRKYLWLNDDKKMLSEFYFERGNYEEAIKIFEDVAGKNTKEFKRFKAKCKYFEGVGKRLFTPIVEARALVEERPPGATPGEFFGHKEVRSIKIPASQMPGQPLNDERKYPPVVQPEPKVVEPNPPQQAIIMVEEALVWDRPAQSGIAYRAIAKVGKGTEVTIIDDTYKWYYKVVLPDGTHGWVCSALLELNP